MNTVVLSGLSLQSIAASRLKGSHRTWGSVCYKRQRGTNVNLDVGSPECHPEWKGLRHITLNVEQASFPFNVFKPVNGTRKWGRQSYVLRKVWHWFERPYSDSNHEGLIRVKQRWMQLIPILDLNLGVSLLNSTMKLERASLM